MPSRLWLAMGFGALALALSGSPGRTGAQATVPGEVMVILASETPGVIAPELAGIAALLRPPFSGFPTMSLLARHPIELTIGTPLEVPLPNGRAMRVVIEERHEDGRYRTRVTIPGYLPGFEVNAAPCDPFFLAGQSFSGGRLVLGVRIGEACR